MKPKFYVTKKLSSKGKEYVALMADVGYRQVVLSYDLNTISQVTDMKISELYTIPLDSRTDI